MADKSNLEIHHRHSLRLKAFDYSQEGAYFVTICTQNKECLFGDVLDGAMRLNDVGGMIESVWNELPQYYPGVDLDAFVVMPNHIHGIIILVGAAPRGRPPASRAYHRPGPRAHQTVGATPRGCPFMGQAQGPAPTKSLPDIVHRFKSLTTAYYRQGVRHEGWRPFAGRLWQRNYYEHVIRNDEDLNRVREYIVNNPALWAEDENNPARLAKTLRAPSENRLID